MIKVQFNFTDSDGCTCHTYRYFHELSGLQSDVDGVGEEYADDGELDYDGYKIIGWDDAYGDPTDFVDLDMYGEHAEAVDDLGEKYLLRFDDVGDFNIDQYEGVWESREEYAKDYSESCGSLPDEWANYIDWSAYADDLLADYSEYDGSEGLHIFRDY